MKIKYNALFCLLTLFLTFSTPASADEFDEILDLIPADAAVVTCLPNPQAFDATCSQIAKEFDANFRGLSKEFQSFGKNVDLSKPAALLFLIPEGTTFSAMETQTVFLLPVKNFAAFIEEHGAVENAEKNWEITFKGDSYLVQQKGNFAVLAKTNPHSTKPNQVLAHYLELAKKGVLKSRIAAEQNTLKNSSFFVHLSIPTWRKTITDGMKQARQFLPIVVMGASQNGGDPTATQNLFSGIVDLIEEFFAQCASLNVSINLEARRAHLTSFVRFEPGPILEYLKTQKPARPNLFTGLPQQDFAVAFALDQPSEGFKAYQYFATKLLPQGTGDSTLQELLPLMQGYSGIMGLAENTEKKPATEMYFQYFSKEPIKLLSLFEKFMQTPNPFLDVFAKGIQYKLTGTRKVGETEIHDWVIDAEEASDLVQESMEKMYGTKPRFAMSADKLGMRYALGGDKTADAFLAGKISKQLSEDPRLQAALAKLPTQTNGVFVVDLVHMARMGMAMTGMENNNNSEIKKSSEFMAFSVNLSGEPTRFDLELPFEPIQNLIGLFASTTTKGSKYDDAPPSTLAPGAMAPDWELKNEKGETVSLKSLRGKVVLMDFWATWCGPCRQSMPRIQKIHERFAGKPVAVYGINCWEDSAEKAKEYMKEKKYSYGLLLEGDELATKYKVKGIPTFYLIGTDGKILYSTSGFSSSEEEELIEAIEKALPK